MRKTEWTDSLLDQAVAEMSQGIIDANLGGGVMKKRIGLAGRGKWEAGDSVYVSRMVNLTTLAPDIVEAILDDTLPNTVTPFRLALNTPLLWEEQRALLKSA